MAGKPTCETCRFWELHADNLPDEPDPQPVYGFCRRFPPTRGEERVEMYGGFPFVAGRPIATRPGDWCGEWQARNPQTVDDAAAVMARAVLAGDAAAGRQLADKLIELIPLEVRTRDPESHT